MRLSTITGSVVAACAVLAAPAGAQNYEEIFVPPPIEREIAGKTAADVNAASTFSVAEQIEAQYVAITVEMTKTSITPLDARLIRGPAQPASSATRDLEVRALAGVREMSRYGIADPRFRSKEQGVTGENRPWVEQPVASKVIYIPLSSLVDKVEISPAPGRAGTVSSGGEFDPRPWATLACDGHDPNLYPNCDAILLLGIPIP